MEKSKALKNKLSYAINDLKVRLPEIESYMDFLKGKQYIKPKKDEVTFNICHTTVQAVLNSIIRGKSHIYVEPRSAEAIGSETLVEKIINFWWEYLKVKYQTELTVIDYAALGRGVTYTDWDFRQDEKGMITNDEPFVLHIPYKDFLFDPQARVEEIYASKYMIRKFVRPTKELKADSRYRHTKNLKGDSKISPELTNSEKEGVELSTLYQIWIPEDKQSYVMVEGNEDILREVPNKFGRDYPFTLIQNYKMPGELHPFGEVKILYEPQKTLNQIFTLIIKHARKVSTRQYVANGQISTTELRKMKDAEDGEILTVEGTAKASDVLSPIMDAALSADVYRAYDIINSAIVQLSSISEYRRGTMPDTERKATEANYIEQGTEMSTNSKAEDVAEHSEDVAKKIFLLLKHPDNIQGREITYKDEKTGDWLSQIYNNQSFPGEFAYKWESGVEAPVNQSTRYQKALALLSTISTVIGSNPQLAAKINWTELLRSTLADSDTKNLEKILTPEEPVMGTGMEQGIEGMTGVNPELANAVMSRLGG